MIKDYVTFMLFNYKFLKQAKQNFFMAVKHDGTWKMVQCFMLNRLLGMKLEAESWWLHNKVWIIAP